MGKETKIGLAVITVLMSVFSVLLFRHLQASHKEPMRGLGDQTAVKPLATHGDVTVASDESRITGSKLWDTPGGKQTPATVEIAAGDATDPYETNLPAAERNAEVATRGSPASPSRIRRANSPPARGRRTQAG